MNKSPVRASPSKRKRSESVPLAQGLREVCINLIPVFFVFSFTHTHYFQVILIVSYGSDDEEVSKKKQTSQKSSASKKGSSSRKVAFDVQWARKESLIFHVSKQAEELPTRHLSWSHDSGRLFGTLALVLQASLEGDSAAMPQLKVCLEHACVGRPPDLE